MAGMQRAGRFRGRLRRQVLAAAVAVMAVVTSPVAAQAVASPAAAAASPAAARATASPTPAAASPAAATHVFPTMNDAGGIFWRSAPRWSAAEVSPGNGFYPGTDVTVYCYQSGTSVPGNPETMWVQAAWASGPGRGHGWMSEHYVDDHALPDRAAPGVPPCGQNMVNQAKGSWCLDADSNHYTSNGDRVQLWACNSHPEQQWVLTPIGQLQSAGTGYCLDANSNDWPKFGDNLQLWQCNTHPEQLWNLTSSGQLENTGTGMCLDANSLHFPSYGDNIQLWGCNTHPEQLWRLGAVAASAPAPAPSPGPTSAERDAAQWAHAQNGSASWGGACLAFAFQAWLAGAHQPLRGWVNYPIGNNTYPQQIWGRFRHGRTGTSTPPPEGALVFFLANPGRSYTISHVEVSLGNGYMMSTSDSVSSGVHVETLQQHADSGAWNHYVGWWLPDA